MEGIDGVKSQKLGNKQGRNVYVRRTLMENLPDVLLLHILSFLPTEDVVRTCILAKRWRNFWKLVSHVEVKEERRHGRISDNSEDEDEDETSRRVSFMNFVETVLLLRDSSEINYFSLSVKVLRDASRINNWIFAALTHKVQKLRLKLSQIVGEDFELPSSLFTSRSLTQLKLKSVSHLRLPSTIFLPQLEVLELRFVTFSGDISASRLFSGCPSLKKLRLENFDWSKVQSISAPRVEELTILDDTCSSSPRACQVITIGANLKHFSYTGELHDNYFLNSSSLISGCIYLESPYGIDDSKSQKEIAWRAHKLLWQLAGVKTLSISPSTLEILDWAKDLFAHFPYFHRLVTLLVDDEIMVLPSTALLTILQKSPKLSQLDFDWGFALSGDLQPEAMPLIDPVPSCFLTHLKTVKIKAYSQTDGELYILRQLLGAASVLEKVYIWSLELKNGPEAILRLYRQSRTCQIILSCFSEEV